MSKQNPLTEREAFMCYYDGLEAGVERFAWWKDGVQYVGTTGKTLNEAYADIERERQRAYRDCEQ